MSIFTVASRSEDSWRNSSWFNLMIVMPFALGAIFLIWCWNIDRQIAVREQTAVGTITAHEPANRNRYGYTFVVEGKSYTGWETPLQ